MEGFFMFEGQNEIEFSNRFNKKDSCYAYLAHYKWKDGFVCQFCNSTVEYNVPTRPTTSHTGLKFWGSSLFRSDIFVDCKLLNT